MATGGSAAVAAARIDRRGTPRGPADGPLPFCDQSAASSDPVLNGPDVLTGRPLAGALSGGSATKPPGPGPEPRGWFRAVTLLIPGANHSLSSKWRLHRVPAFLAANAELEVRLDGTNEPTDFSKEGVDKEIRQGEGRWPGLYIEGLAEENFLPICAPSYCEPGSLDAADLPQHRLIQSVKSQVQWGHWFEIAGVTPRERLRRVLFDRSHMAIDAAAGGIGVALESSLMMWRELRDGLLICPVRDPPAVSRTTQSVVCPRDHLRHRKVRAFVDWLRVERDAWIELERRRLAAIL